MAFGLTAFNDGGQLTFSSDAFTYGYIGRATLNEVRQAGTNTIAAASGRCLYSIEWPGNIVPAVAIKPGQSSVITAMSRVGNTWSIVAYNGGGSVDSLGFETQVATEVYVFGQPVSVSGWGLALYDQAGQLTADLSRRPLIVGGFRQLASDALTAPMPALGVPAIIGTEVSTRWATQASGALWINRLYAGAWQLDTGTSELRRELFQDARTRDDGPFSPALVRPAVTALLIDVAGL